MPAALSRRPGAAQRDTTQAPVVLLAILISGLAGLMHEIVWAKLLVSLIGSTAHSQAVVLTVFMGGLAAGALIFGRRSDRGGSPLRTYVRLELAIAAYALLLPLLVRGGGLLYERLAPSFLDSTSWKLACRVAVAALVVLAPAVMMGGTLPVLARHLVTRLSATRKAVASLYALNNVGAVLGACLAGFVTLEAFGIWISLALASAANLLAALLAWAALRRTERVAAAAPKPEADRGARRAPEPEALPVYGPGAFRATLVALAMSGFAAMGYEVVFTRVIALAFGSSTYSFTVMLACFIGGIGIGSAIASRLRVKRPMFLLGFAQLAAVVSLLLSTPLVERLPYLIALLRIAIVESSGAFGWYVAGQTLLCFAVLLVPTVWIGLAFPLVTQIQARSMATVGGVVGSTYAWNTVGNVLGVLVTSLVLLPGLGAFHAFHVNLALHAGAGALMLAAASEVAIMARVATAWGAGAIGLAYVFLLTGWIDSINLAPNHLRLRTGPIPGMHGPRHAATSYRAWRDHLVARREELLDLFLEEDANTTVLAVSSEDGSYLYVNGKPDASTTSDLSTQLLLAHVPMFMTPEAKSLLVIGYGSGITFGSAMLHPVERADLVEISSGVLNADRLFRADNYGVLSDPRVSVHHDDARTFLRTVPRSYDVIVSEPSNPWVAGVGGLFTREFFEEARARLNPRGRFCVWFHEYEQTDESVRLVLRTLHAVFPQVHLFREYAGGRDVVAVATMEPIVPDFAALESRFDTPALRNDLARIRAFNLASLLAHHAISPERFGKVVGEGPVHTEDHQSLEYTGPRSFFRNDKAELLWDHDALYQRMGEETDSLVDRYARWRQETGDPIRAREWESAARHIAGDLGPSDRGQQVARALRSRAQRAPSEPGDATKPSRGAIPPPSAMSYWEALSRASADAAERGPAEVMTLLERAIEVRPDDVQARLALGAELRQRDRVPESIRVLEAALAHRPTSARIRVQLGHAYYRTGDYARAKELFEESLKNVENGEALVMLGQVAAKTGDRPRALEMFAKAVDVTDGAYSSAVYAYAVALEREPLRRREAVAVVRRGLMYYPDQPDLVKLLRRLEGAP